MNRHAILAGVLAGLSLTATGAEVASERLLAPTSFDIPAQALSTALKQLADQAGVQILFEERVVQGMAAPAVRSRESAVDALRVLLNGTGLEFATRGETIAVREEAPLSRPFRRARSDRQRALMSRVRRSCCVSHKPVTAPRRRALRRVRLRMWAATFNSKKSSSRRTNAPNA